MIMARPFTPRVSETCRSARGVSNLIRLLKREQGSGLVEYAIIFMLFMTMLLGIAEFGRALYAYHYVSNAAREATRYAAVRGSTCAGDGSCTAPATTANILTFVKNTPAGLDPTLVTCPTCSADSTTWLHPTGSPTICTTAPTTTNEKAPGCTVQVQVNYAFTFEFPFVSTQTLTLTSTSQMIISH